MIKSLAFATRKPAEKLSILYSCRLRLTDEQRAILKNAYYKKINEVQPKAQPPIGGSSVRTDTVYSNNGLNLSHLVVVDLLATRESVSLTTILSLQKELEVTAVNKDDLRTAFESYLDYCWKIVEDNND